MVSYRYMPVRYDSERETFEQFAARVAPVRVVDQYAALLEDLFLIRNPRFKFIKEYTAELDAFTQTYCAGRAISEKGNWFYFPWNGVLAHYLPENEHQELRTARNRNIITEQEQQQLYDLRVAFAGLSVGSHALFTFLHMGGGKRIKIADPDAVSPSNLNRMRYDFLQVGRKKTDLALEYAYQLNPYAEIEIFPEGINDANIHAFLKDVDVLVEETDNLLMKIMLRIEARNHGLPVLMATDNGDNIIFEADRFDIDPKAQLFNGAIGDISVDQFKSFPMQELPRLATKIAGPQFITERMIASVAEVGKTIYSWPQLADAATLSGVAIAYALKQIATKQPLITSKCEMSLDATLDPTYEATEQKRREIRARFLGAMGL